jgi:hypothetical protein
MRIREATSTNKQLLALAKLHNTQADEILLGELHDYIERDFLLRRPGSR